MAVIRQNCAICGQNFRLKDGVVIYADELAHPDCAEKTEARRIRMFEQPLLPKSHGHAGAVHPEGGRVIRDPRGL